MNTNAKLAGIVTITVLALAGCAKDGPHGGHSEKWYEQHPTAMKAENKWCAGQSPDVQVHSKSCERAGWAATAVMYAKSAKQATNNLCTQPGIEQAFGPKLYQQDCPGYNLDEHKVAK
jgi:hypothetical protein